MKVRKGFVSNSSSSSFIINRSKITYEQECLIQKACSEVDDKNYSISGWKLFYTYGSIIGYTSMDNFDIKEYFDKIKIPEEAIYWAEKELNDWVGGNPFDYRDPEFPEKELVFDNKVTKKMRNVLKSMGYKYKPKREIP